jgi:ATP phosphoribosyltransferase
MKAYQDGYIKLALPKGRFLSPTASLLAEIDLGFEGYSDRTKQYRLRSARFPSLSAKILQEKDISIQVAVGNYDLGICGSDWIEEFLVKYPAGALVKISSLNYGEGCIHVVASAQAGIANLNELSARRNDYRIVTEYPNLAEAFALNLRMRRFRIFPVWGAAEAYPPENADLAVLWGKCRPGGALGKEWSRYSNSRLNSPQKITPRYCLSNSQSRKPGEQGFEPDINVF